MAHTNPSQITENEDLTGSKTRTVGDKFSDMISVLDFTGVDKTGATDSTAGIQAAIDYAKTRTGAGSVNKGGFTVYFPEGIYSVSSLNLSSPTSVFYRQIRLQGAGRWATTLVANSTGKIIIDMLGQNLAEVSDLSIDSTSFQSQCAIFLSRSATSTQANDNHFESLHITGNYSKAAVVSLGAESTGWYHCRFENSNSAAASWSVVPTPTPTHVTFYSGDDNTEIGVTTTNGTILTGGNTDNTMLDCQFYAPFDNATLTYFHNTAAYRFIGGSWIAGTQNAVHLVTLQSTTGVFNGPIDFIGSHFEWFGTGAAIYLDANNTLTVFKGLHVVHGFFNANGGLFIDYDRTTVANKADIVDANINSVKGTAGSSGFQIYVYGIESSQVHWQPFDDATGVVAIFGFINDSVIKTWTLFPPGPQSSTNRYHYLEQYASAIPTTGTYSAGHIIWNTAPVSGGPLGWIATTAGTLGSLNGNATTITCTSGTNTGVVSTATGLSVGQHVVCGANGVHTVTAIVGTTIYVSTTWSANVTGGGLFFAGPTVVPFGTVGALAPTRTVLAYSASIATDASLGNSFSITATNGTAFTIANPTSLTTGQRLLYTIRNTSGGALGATTWGTTFKVAAPTALTIATGNSLSLEFVYDGTNLIEVFRTPVVVPN